MNLRLLLFHISLVVFQLTNGSSSLKIRKNRNSDLHKSNSTKPVTLSFKPDNYDYFVKLLPKDEPEEQCPIKRISEKYVSTLRISTDLQLANHDLMQCEVTNADYNEISKPIFVIHTTGSSTDESGVVKFSNPTEKNCFSFRVKTGGIAKIYLYNNLNPPTTNHYVEIGLGIGSNENKQSYMWDIHRTCSECKNVDTENILDSNELRGFWITWEDSTFKVGKEHETTPFLEETFNKYVIKNEVNFIGFGSPNERAYGTWHVEKPFCPDILVEPVENRSVITKCHKIFDPKKLKELNLSKEDILLKRVQALKLEFEVDLKTKQHNLVKKLEEYYIDHLEGMSNEIYHHLYRKCAKNNCNETTLTTIETSISELRNLVQGEIKKLVADPQCSHNAYFNEYNNKCVCNSNYAGNGLHCEIDSDKDGIPDKDIQECSDRRECQRDNCPNVSNPDQNDVNKNGIGDECEKFSLTDLVSSMEASPFPSSNEETYEENPEKLNCENITIPRIMRRKCKLDTAFSVVSDKENLELIFSQKNGKIYKFTWGNKDWNRFTLNKLESLEDKVDTDSWSSRTNLIWAEETGKQFLANSTYRMIISYEFNKLNIWIRNEQERTAIEYTITEKVEFEKLVPISQLCSNMVEWRHEVFHSCSYT